MIITLCGSARFEDAWHYWNERLSLDGHVVLSLAVYPSIKGSKNWYDDETKAKLDAIHLKKIDASNAIFVITSELHFMTRYIGASTQREIDHAKRSEKLVIYSDECCAYLGCPNRLRQRPPCVLCYE